jgi:hypothetical protein
MPQRWASDTLKTVQPTKDDLAQTELAIRSFPNAWGSVSRDGTFTPSAADPSLLWMQIGSGAAQMNALWRQAGIDTGAKSSYAAMMAAKEHTVSIVFFKVRKALFRSGWVGDVSLDFANGNLYVGSVAGRTQADMWRQLRAFLDDEAKLYPSTAAAQEAV